MTAKKMADIFFGKFSELISTKDTPSNEILTDEKIDKQDQLKPKTQNQKVSV